MTMQERLKVHADIERQNREKLEAWKRGFVRFKITYYLMPEAANIDVVVTAKSYEDACVIAKGYRQEGFSCNEITGQEETREEGVIA